MFVMPSRGPRFNEAQLREAIGRSRSWSETLRRLRYRSAGGNWRTLQKYAALWEISTAHFDPLAASLEGLRRCRIGPIPLPEVLVSGSSYCRANLKRRLLAEGLKQPVCELCGQGELWQGRRIALILDHINGIPNDNRLENLRIVCPNCAATFDTHCGRQNRKPPRNCALCGAEFRPKYREQRYCSRNCGQRVSSVPRRQVIRPPYDQLLREIEKTSYLAVGRKYGVSDNAIRKWVRFYEREAARRAAEVEDDAEAA